MMRLDELKDIEQINEVGRLASVFGTYNAARLKQLGNRLMGDPEGQMSVADKAHKEEFINDLFGKAFKSLNSEIASGRVDPSLKGSTPPSPSGGAGTPSGKTAPGGGAGTPSGKTALGTANKTTPGATQRQTSQNINNYVRNVAASLNKAPDARTKMALAKELVNFMADRKDYPEWQNAIATAQNIIKKGIADPNFANSAMNRLKAGQMMEAWQVYWINKLLESVGYTFKDLGFTLLKENKQNGKYILAETKYHKLNMIFEEIMTEAESVEQWMQRWLPAYLKGIPINDPTTQALIKSTANAYDPNNIKPFKTELLKLANAIFATAQAPGYGAGSPTSATGGKETDSATADTSKPTPAKPDAIVSNLQNLLTKLKGIDPALHAEMLRRIKDGKPLSGIAESIKKRLKSI